MSVSLVAVPGSVTIAVHPDGDAGAGRHAGEGHGVTDALIASTATLACERDLLARWTLHRTNKRDLRSIERE
jgi:hypothetical protein